MHSEPSLCPCGHYRYIHQGKPCGGWSRKKRRMLPLPFGFHIRILRLCQCKGAH